MTLSVVVLGYKRLLLLTKTSLFIRLISLYYLHDSNFGQLKGKTYKLYICTLVWRRTKAFRDWFFCSINMSYIVLHQIITFAIFFFLPNILIHARVLGNRVSKSRCWLWSRNSCMLCFPRSCKRSWIDKEWGRRSREESKAPFEKKWCLEHFFVITVLLPI